MATELNRNERQIQQRERLYDAVFIDAVEMANIERAVANGAGRMDQYAPTGSDDLDEAQVRTMITEALIAAKVETAKLYAFLTIGCLVTIENAPLLTATQVTQWTNAVQDYRQRHCGHA